MKRLECKEFTGQDAAKEAQRFVDANLPVKDGFSLGSFTDEKVVVWWETENEPVSNLYKLNHG